MNKQAMIFIGPAGAGKGTIAAMCAQVFGWQQLSTGNLCRQHIQQQTELGKQLETLVNSGNLVPDALIMDMVAQWMSAECKEVSAVIFDGIPRTREQLEALHSMLTAQTPVWQEVVILFSIDQILLEERILYRIVCSNKACQAVYSVKPGSLKNPMIDEICDVCGAQLLKRSDDTIEILKTRLNGYYQLEKDMVYSYQEKGVKIITLDAQQSVDEVFRSLQQQLQDKDL